MKLSFEPIARLLVTLYGVFPIFGLPFWIGWLVADGELPEQIASHWGITGQADGFMAPEDFAIAMGIVFGVLWILATWILWTPRLPQLTRWVIVIPLLLIYAGLFSLVVESVLLQRGVTDVTQVQLPTGSLILLFASIPLILGFTLSMPKVAIDDKRIEASIWAIPIFRMPLEEIQSVELVELRARDFGGLGMRFGRGGFAIIPRSGAGIALVGKNGKRVSIRCTNAAEIVEILKNKES